MREGKVVEAWAHEGKVFILVEETDEFGNTAGDGLQVEIPPSTLEHIQLLRVTQLYKPTTLGYRPMFAHDVRREKNDIKHSS